MAKVREEKDKQNRQDAGALDKAWETTGWEERLTTERSVKRAPVAKGSRL